MCENLVRTEKVKSDDSPEWLKKCMKCVHSYYRKNDADTLYCRCRKGKCNFKEYVLKTPDWR